MISDLKSWIISRLHFTFETIFWFWFTNKIHIFPNYPRNCRIWSVFFSSIEWNHSFLGLWGRIIDKWHIIRIIRKDENGIFTDIRVTSFFFKAIRTNGSLWCQLFLKKLPLYFFFLRNGFNLFLLQMFILNVNISTVLLLFLKFIYPYSVFNWSNR